MSNCIVCGRPLKSTKALADGMGKTCAKVFSGYDKTTQEKLLGEYHSNQGGSSLKSRVDEEIQASSFLTLFKHNQLSDYRNELQSKIALSEEPERSLYEQELWETENKMLERYELERTREPRLPETMPERLSNAVYQLYRKDHIDLSTEQADSMLPAFKKLLEKEEQLEEKMIQEELSTFGTEFLDDADYRINPNDRELPENEDREYYLNVLHSIFREDDEFAYTRIHFDEVSKESLYRIANIYYKLSKRYLPSLKSCPRLSTFKEFDRANQSTGLRFHAVTRDIGSDYYNMSGGFYLNGSEEKSYLPATAREKVNDIGLYLNENVLNDSYTTMGDFFKKEREKGITTTHFAEVPDNIPYRDYIVVHETGHLLHDQINFNSQTQKKLNDFFQENRQRIGQSLSRYAMSSTDEMVAEAFVDFTLNHSPSVVSMEVMDILNEKFYNSPAYSTVDEEQARKVIKTAKFHTPTPEKELLQKLLRGN